MRRMYFTNSGLSLTPDGSDMPTGLPVSVAEGGTGASDAAGARTNLGVSASGADTAYAWRANNLSDLTNAGTARINLGLGNVENKSSATIRSEITSGNVTGALGYTPLNPASNLADVASVATARGNLGVSASGADAAYAWRANNLSDLTNAGTARTNLGLGTAATKNTGTSGNTVPLLDGANTFSGATTVFNGNLRVANGYFKCSDTGSYPNLANPTHEFVTSGTSFWEAAIFESQHASSPYGVQISFTGSSPNNAANYFLIGLGLSTTFFKLLSNGGLANFSANNVNLSDAMLKTDITPYADADLDALEESFKSVDWGTFKYKDQTHADPNHGYTAQGVEAAFAGVAPELVDETDLGPAAEDGTPQKHKCVYATDLTNIAHALLARALKRIEELERRAVRL